MVAINHCIRNLNDKAAGGNNKHSLQQKAKECYLFLHYFNSKVNNNILKPTNTIEDTSEMKVLVFMKYVGIYTPIQQFPALIRSESSIILHHLIFICIWFTY